MSIKLSQKDFQKLNGTEEQKPTPKQNLPNQNNKIVRVGDLQFTQKEWEREKQEVAKWQKQHWILDKIIGYACDKTFK